MLRMGGLITFRAFAFSTKCFKTCYDGEKKKKERKKVKKIRFKNIIFSLNTHEAYSNFRQTCFKSLVCTRAIFTPYTNR